MSLKSVISQGLQQSLHCAYRPPEILGVAAHDLFTLSGGPAWVKSFIMYADVATGQAAQWNLTICGVIAENGGAAVANLLIGEMAVWPLHGDNAADVAVPNIANTPYYPLASQLLGMQGGILIAPGGAGGNVFVMDVTVLAALGAHSCFVQYYKMRPETLIAPM